MSKVKCVLSWIAFLICLQVQAQSVTEIKESPDYLWGEGSDVTIGRADKWALQVLTEAISAEVESSFSREKEWGEGRGFKAKVQSVIGTYGTATEKHTQRIVVSNEPDAIVVRYIKKNEIKNIFTKRKLKAYAFVQSAELALSKEQIADALRNYNWAWFLLKSHPDAANIYNRSEVAQQKPMVETIPDMVNAIFQGIKVGITKVEKEPEVTLVHLSFEYNGKPVDSFDFSFWNGSDWSVIHSARNGMALIELPVSDTLKEVKIRGEYIYASEARIDHEMEVVIDKITPIPYRTAYFTAVVSDLPPSNNSGADENGNVQLATVTTLPVGNQCESIVLDVVQAIQSKNWESAKPFFTADGYDVFLRLIKTGQVRILGTPNLQSAEFYGQTMVRSVPMRFDFKSNQRKFIEDVVFHFDETQKISSVTFGLSKLALDNIMKKTVWDEKARLLLVNFLEHYKTAYALKRLDYIESIFADDALIIIGNYSLQQNTSSENSYAQSKVLKYNRYSKEQYLKKLKYSFDSKEYINLRFEESYLRKSGKSGELYGIQIKQNYFSSNYGDTGYLFLMVDLNNPHQPVIHVRTWQPERNLDGSIYGLSHF